MKRLNDYLKDGASLISLSKLAFICTVLFALEVSLPSTLDAQRRSGGREVRTHTGSRDGHSRMHYGNIHHGNFRNRTYVGYNWYRGYPHWRYYSFPFWGAYYWGIPAYSWRFTINSYDYLYDDGIYYRYEKNKYRVVPAPVGYKVKKLPKGAQEFSLDGVTYYYFYGSYYTPEDGKYLVVEAPIGALVESIPDGYDKVVIDGQSYFSLHGVQYKAEIRDNEVWYRVIKNNDKTVPSADETEPYAPYDDEDMAK